MVLRLPQSIIATLNLKLFPQASACRRNIYLDCARRYFSELLAVKVCLQS